MIDSHQHFWIYNPQRDQWIGDEMGILKQDFLPADLQPILEKNSIRGCIAVQSSETDSGNAFLLDLAAQHEIIKGVVGWIDPASPELEARLNHYQSFPKLKGFRHMLQSEKQRDSMLHPAFRKGIGLLQQYGFTFDFIILPDQLAFACELAEGFPGQPFVIDHLAKPPVRSGRDDDWKKNIRRIAALPNVYCKISGLVTEANWNSWKSDPLSRYLDVVTGAFGMDRLMFGSDWPVCLLAAEYEEVRELTDKYFSAFSASEREQFYELNATRFYSL